MNLPPNDSCPGVDLNSYLVTAGLDPIDEESSNHFSAYLSLLLRWNARMNLTAIRDVDGILARHFVESIACARLLPNRIRSLLDIGSGAGFPGIPIALCRPEIEVVLAESQRKKASFLREVVRTLHLGAEVFGRRAEELDRTFDCVILRAVDRMNHAIAVSTTLVRPGGFLAVVTVAGDLAGIMGSVGSEFRWRYPKVLPGSERRVLALAEREQAL